MPQVFERGNIYITVRNTELVLLGADEDVFEELGVPLNRQRETVDTAEIFNELHMERRDHALKPLFEGRWQ